MGSPLSKVVKEANDLQAVIARLSESEAGGWLQCRHFLNELTDDDFRTLATLSIEEKLAYLSAGFRRHLGSSSRGWRGH